MYFSINCPICENKAKMMYFLSEQEEIAANITQYTYQCEANPKHIFALDKHIVDEAQHGPGNNPDIA